MKLFKTFEGARKRALFETAHSNWCYGVSSRIVDGETVFYVEKYSRHVNPNAHDLRTRSARTIGRA